MVAHLHDFGILTSQRIRINNMKVYLEECVNVTGTVLGRLRSNAPHVRSVRKDDMRHQGHLLDGLLTAQGTSTFVIVNPE